jgi:hypothetical protein
VEGAQSISPGTLTQEVNEIACDDVGGPRPHQRILLAGSRVVDLVEFKAEFLVEIVLLDDETNLGLASRADGRHPHMKRRARLCNGGRRTSDYEQYGSRKPDHCNSNRISDKARRTYRARWESATTSADINAGCGPIEARCPGRTQDAERQLM